MAGIVYGFEPDLSAAEFRAVLVASGLGARRPVDEPDRLDAMLRHADVVATAREDGRLVGVACAVTDFAYCCYLSDLAVDAAWHGRGVGRRLVEETRARAGGEAVTLVLVAAPAAEGYYPRIAMEHVPSCWALRRTR